MYKKLFTIFFLFLFSFFLFVPSVFAENNQEIKEESKITVYFFEDRLCPVCRDQKNFMESLKENYPQMTLIIYPISDVSKFEEIAKMHGVNNPLIMSPTTFIGDNFFQFSSFGDREKQKIIDALEGEIVERDIYMIRIPLLNIIVDISDWSLLLITSVLGILDGFNVCSIAALILILSIVLVFKSRKKILFFGGIFILTTVIVYGILVFMWGQLFRVLIGYSEMFSYIVGIAAFLGGLYFLKEFRRFYKYGPTCEFGNNKIVRKATEKIQKSFADSSKGTLILAGSIIVFVTIITIIEFPCSAGIPIIFTGILIEAGVSSSESIFYILFYLLFYMIDEMIIFLGAVFTREIWIANSKAITWFTLIGALILFYLSYYYIFGL